MGTCAKRKKSGFTLVEIIVCATIFSFVAVGIATVFISGMKLWSRLERGTIRQEGVMIDLEAIARQLRQTVKITQAGFSGSYDKISFTSLTGSQVIQYTYTFHEFEKSVLQKQQALKDILEEKETVVSKEYIRGVEKFKLSYLRVDTQSQEAQWSSDWEEKNGYPLAVKIEGQKNGFRFEKTVFIPIVLTR